MPVDNAVESNTSRELQHDADITHVFAWKNTNPHEVLRSLRHRIATRGDDNDDKIEYSPVSIDDNPLDIQSVVEKTGVVTGELEYVGDRTQFYTETVDADDGQSGLLRFIGSVLVGTLTTLLALIGVLFVIASTTLTYLNNTTLYSILDTMTGIGVVLSPGDAGLVGGIVAVFGVWLTLLVSYRVQEYYGEWQYETSEQSREWYLEPVATITFDGEVGETSAYEGDMQSTKSVLHGDFDVIISENVTVEIEEDGEVIETTGLERVESHEAQTGISNVYDPLVFSLNIQDHTAYASMPKFLHTMN